MFFHRGNEDGVGKLGGGVEGKLTPRGGIKGNVLLHPRAPIGFAN